MIFIVSCNEFGIILKFSPYKQSGIFFGKWIANCFGFQMISSMQDARSSGFGLEPGHSVVFLGKITYSHGTLSAFRTFALIVSAHPYCAHSSPVLLVLKCR